MKPVCKESSALIWLNRKKKVQKSMSTCSHSKQTAIEMSVSLFLYIYIIFLLPALLQRQKMGLTLGLLLTMFAGINSYSMTGVSKHTLSCLTQQHCSFYYQNVHHKRHHYVQVCPCNPFLFSEQQTATACLTLGRFKQRNRWFI